MTGASVTHAMKSIRFVVLFAVVAAIGSVSQAADWLTAPSYYTHDDAGRRVAQHTPTPHVYVYQPPNYVRSGYRNIRSTIQGGGSADNLHVVEEWGRPVIPYETWRSPYRPYAVPYDQWAPPFAGTGFGGGFGFGGYPAGPGFGYGSGFGAGGFGGSGFGQNRPFFPGVEPFGPRPWNDGYYPSYDLRDRSDYYRPYLPDQSSEFKE